MIPTELSLTLDFRSGGDPGCMSHWLKAYDAPCMPREGDFVDDDAAPEREELLCVQATQFKVNSSHLTVLLDSVEPSSLDEYLDRMRELRAGGWHELEDPFVYENPLLPVPVTAPAAVAIPTQVRFDFEIAPAEGTHFASVRSTWYKIIPLPYALQKGSGLTEPALCPPGQLVDTGSMQLVVSEAFYDLKRGRMEADMEKKQVRWGGQEHYDFIVKNLEAAGWEPFPYANIIFTSAGESDSSEG